MSNKVSKPNSALDPNITVQDLMALDFRYDYSPADLLEDWQRLCKTKKFKTGSQFKPGMKLCQHFCTNFWDIENTAGQSFAKAWQDPVIMQRVLDWGRQGMSQLWLSWIRRAVFMNAGLANSSFYRPHFSKQLIQMHGAPQGTLYDPCAGWGGRMLGTAAAGWQYQACEPNTQTHANLDKMIEFLGIGHQVTVRHQTAETFDVGTVGPVDIVLTSPPYFNLEIYTRARDQSYNQHMTYADWRDHWYQPLIQHCLDNLRLDGISAWNVMNFGRNDLVGDMIAVHQRNGWNLVGTLGFQTPLSNIRKIKNRDVTYVFRHHAWQPPRAIVEF